MTFTQSDKFKALAIVHVFETSRPFGDYGACVVLDDGAGVSYGINQFTHRSGSLAAVVEQYLKNGGKVGATVMNDCLTDLHDASPASIRRLAANAQFRSALRSAAVTREMKFAQADTAFRLYLGPAVAICEKYFFTEPLSLAVVYDSVVHGSFYRVARGVYANRGNERAWITAYVRRRDGWLASYPRLTRTRYRTRFFLNQIAISNWRLRLPLNVNGLRLTAAVEVEQAATVKTAAHAEAATELTEKAREIAAKAAAGFDRVESAVSAVTTRADAAKSMWTTVIGTFWQAAWAVFGFLAGLPRAVWMTAAVIAGVLMLAYLYRQIALGKIRESTAVH